MSLEDLAHYESVYGKIAPNSLVIAHTGWSRFWNQPERYRNVDGQGQMHFPAFSRKAAEFLLARDVAGIAIDTLSPDCLDHEFPVHQVMLGHGKYIIENVADCSKLPAHGAYCMALPLRVEGGTESPIRMVGLVL